MGKDGELRDDSALIDAFEDAISCYKMMHGMKEIDYELKVAVHIGHITAEVIDDEEDVKSCVDGTASDADASSNSLVEAALPTKDKEVNEAASNGTLELERDSNVQPVAEADYNSLVNQYYELQEKLQVTWQQLQQFGYSTEQWPQYTTEAGLSDSTAGVKEASVLPSDDLGATLVKHNNDVLGRKPEQCQQFLSFRRCDDQCFTSAGVQGTISEYQGQSTTDSGSRPIHGCCDYPCTGKCVVYSSCPVNACRLCSDAVPRDGPEKSLTLEDNDLIRVAVGAAEKAISSIKIQTADHQGGSGQISVDPMAKSSENNGCETDLSTVLNAWFSAGLATGKYLVEQSNSRRQKG